MKTVLKSVDSYKEEQHYAQKECPNFLRVRRQTRNLLGRLTTSTFTRQQTTPISLINTTDYPKLPQECTCCALCESAAAIVVIIVVTVVVVVSLHKSTAGRGSLPLASNHHYCPVLLESTVYLRFFLSSPYRVIVLPLLLDPFLGIHSVTLIVHHIVGSSHDMDSSSPFLFSLFKI